MSEAVDYGHLMGRVEALNAEVEKKISAELHRAEFEKVILKFEGMEKLTSERLEGLWKEVKALKKGQEDIKRFAFRQIWIALVNAIGVIGFLAWWTITH